ncbi:MAG TPA: flavodoxin domain-containing protein [Puia sp.]|nr:flavodoxin domain-containing protein [Puia sp.]
MATPLDGVLVYRTRYGATLKYAEWIKKELRIPMIDPERMDDQVLSACDFLVIGTPVYLGEMLIRDWLHQNEQRLKGKRLFLFIVCTHFADSEKQQIMIKDNIPAGILARCEPYFLPGGLPVEKLTPEDASLLGLATPPETHRDKKEAATCSIPLQEENILPLVESIRYFVVHGGGGYY